MKCNNTSYVMKCNIDLQYQRIYFDFTSAFFVGSFFGGDLGVSVTEGIFFSGASALFPPPTPPRGGSAPRGDEDAAPVDERQLKNGSFRKFLEFQTIFPENRKYRV